MSIKRLAATAAVAAVLGMSTSTVNAGFASSVPLDPAPCPSWERGCSGSTPAPNNPGYGGAGSQPPMAPAPHSTQPPPSTYQPPHSTQAPPSTYQPPHTTAPPTISWQKPPTTSMPTASTCPNWEKDCTPAPNHGPGYGGATSPTTAWQQPITANGSTTSMPVECPAWEKNCTPAPNPGPGYGGATPTTTGAPWNGSSRRRGGMVHLRSRGPAATRRLLARSSMRRGLSLPTRRTIRRGRLSCTPLINTAAPPICQRVASAYQVGSAAAATAKRLRLEQRTRAWLAPTELGRPAAFGWLERAAACWRLEPTLARATGRPVLRAELLRAIHLQQLHRPSSLQRRLRGFRLLVLRCLGPAVLRQALNPEALQTVPPDSALRARLNVSFVELGYFSTVLTAFLIGTLWHCPKSAARQPSLGRLRSRENPDVVDSGGLYRQNDGER